MPRKSRIPLRLFSDFNTLPFASVMGMVVLVVLIIFMTVPTSHHGVSADLPKVLHAIALPGANREDAMKVTIMRDGVIYFGVDRTAPSHLRDKIQDRLRDRDVERKVYIVADTRVRWSSVEDVLDGVRSAGILRVAFLTDQGRVPSITRQCKGRAAPGGQPRAAVST